MHEDADIGAQIVEVLPRIRRFAYALTNRAAEADDLLQSTVERALSRSHQFEPGTDVAKWMFRICRNIWIDEMRARKSRGETIEIDERFAPSFDGERQMAARIALSKVKAAMAHLSDDHRAVLALVGMEGLSYKEAAAVLDVPVGTVMSRLARARTQLLTALEG